MAAAGCRIFRTALVCVLAVLVTAGAAGVHVCRADPPGGDSPTGRGAEEKFGIRILSLRPTALGHMLDLRFRVVDPGKAGPVLSQKNEAYLVDAKSGKRLTVPVTKAGSMRQTTLEPEAGRVYFILFSNPYRVVEQDGTVDVVIGDFRKEGLVVGSSGPMPAGHENTGLQRDGGMIKGDPGR